MCYELCETFIGCQRAGFFFQHHRHFISYGKGHTTETAHQFILLLIVLNIAFAQGAGQNLKQFLIHNLYLS